MRFGGKIKHLLQALYSTGMEEFRRALVRHGGTPHPRGLYLDPTYKCNLRCISCRCPGISKLYMDSMQLDGYRRLISEFAGLKGKNVGIYGGEPLLANKVYDIIQIAKSYNLNTHLSTNGLLLNKENSTKLVESKLDSIIISVNGTGDTYNRISGSESYSNFTESLKTFISINNRNNRVIDTSFHVTVMRENFNGLEEILFFARDNAIAKVSFQYLSRVDEQADKKTAGQLEATFDAGRNHWDLDRSLLIGRNQLTELATATRMVKETAKKLGVIIEMDRALDVRFNGDNLTKGVFQLRKPCPALRDDIFIGPDGDINLCPMLTHYPVANIKEVLLADYWKHNVSLVQARGFLRKNRYFSICRHCCSHSGLM